MSLLVYLFFFVCVFVSQTNEMKMKIDCAGNCVIIILLIVHFSEYIYIYFGLLDLVRVSLRQDSHTLAQDLKVSF